MGGSTGVECSASVTSGIAMVSATVAVARPAIATRGKLEANSSFLSFEEHDHRIRPVNTRIDWYFLIIGLKIPNEDHHAKSKYLWIMNYYRA